jgi:hypothetical protein
MLQRSAPTGRTNKAQANGLGLEMTSTLNAEPCKGELQSAASSMARPFRAPSHLLRQTQAAGLGFVSSPLGLKPACTRINNRVRNAG